MHKLKSLWLRYSLYWKRGSAAEAIRLYLLNEALHSEGKFLGSIVTVIPQWRVLALRGEYVTPSTPMEAENPKSMIPPSSFEHINHQLVLTIPEHMYKLRQPTKMY